MSEEVALPGKFRRYLGRPYGMDFHLVNITLKDGRKFHSMTVVHEDTIIGIRTIDGTRFELDFSSDDILRIYPAYGGRSIKRLFALVTVLVLMGIIAILLL